MENTENEVVQEAAAPEPSVPRELDPRAVEMKERLVNLLNSAQGIWKDALQSQISLTQKCDDLQEAINEVKELAALPSYPNGMRQLQVCIGRVQNAKKRIIQVGGRLNHISQILQQQKIQQQRMIMIQQQKAMQEQHRINAAQQQKNKTAESSTTQLAQTPENPEPVPQILKTENVDAPAATEPNVDNTPDQESSIEETKQEEPIPVNDNNQENDVVEENTPVPVEEPNE